MKFKYLFLLLLCIQINAQTNLTWDSDCCCLTIKKPKFNSTEIVCGDLNQGLCEPNTYQVKDLFGNIVKFSCDNLTFNTVPITCSQLCSLMVCTTPPSEVIINDTLDVNLVNDSLKVHFTQPIETYSNDSIKVSILNDSLKVHFTQPIEVINDKIDSLSLVSCISGNALLVQECEKDTVLQSVLTICESCDGNGFDVTSVLGQCSKINFDDNTNASIRFAELGRHKIYPTC